MATLIEKARKGIIAPEMETAAEAESVTPEFIRNGIAEGSIVITKNVKRPPFVKGGRGGIKPLGIGGGLRTKINANIGTSGDRADINTELSKLKIAVESGADTVMDLSTGGDIDSIRREIIKNSSVPIGTVPIYQAICEGISRNKQLEDLTVDDIFSVIERHGEDGVDFITVHCGVTLETVKRMNEEGRLLDIVSRGGALLSRWMLYTKEENPLYSQFDRLIEIAKKHEMVLSLGDGLRPGCLADATDRGQVQETIILGELTDRARKAGVQVMIEGPGHMPINQIPANILLQKRLCHNAPFYVLGPLVTDIAPGYDHITSAIGGAIAAASGADFLCYVTPSEHLSLPTVEDVREGVIASKIAAHAGDIAKGVKGAIDRDVQMAKFRKSLDWEGQIKTAVDPEKARKIRMANPPAEDDVCTMCASFCAIKMAVKKI
ncbi:MAG: phosphomethylpyrimidine synthase ThiC [Nitrospinae bacterium]|nr:phosphomethylpyrimidine synthase ThiC [Nitrospinota bacterium]